MKKCFFFILILLLMIFPFGEKALCRQKEIYEKGWCFPSIGKGNGFWGLSAGAHFWTDHLDFRNLQLLTDVDLGAGLRWHSIIRSNKEMNGLGEWAPRFDEAFIEKYGFYVDANGTLSLSAKLGRSRYLRFPYPDAIATFDQVPGIGDLKGGDETGYSGLILTADYAHKCGLGVHAAWIDWGFGVDRSSNWAERYIFYRNDSGLWHYEARFGDLPIREEVMGETAQGFNLFVGRTFKNWSIGFLYEELEDQPAYTGIVVRFAQGDKTKKMGELAFDYTRAPRGHAVQIPLLSGTIGRVWRVDPTQEPLFKGVLMKPGEDGALQATDYVLVGEVEAERIRTYWQNGQVRNFYEHRLSCWGDTQSPGLVVKMVEEPWYLELESLVSPHTDLWSWDDLKKWEEDRMGPAQLNQKVVYRFYKKVVPGFTF
jgi:hypothetical protein